MIRKLLPVLLVSVFLGLPSVTAVAQVNPFEDAGEEEGEQERGAAEEGEEKSEPKKAKEEGTSTGSEGEDIATSEGEVEEPTEGEAAAARSEEARAEEARGEAATKDDAEKTAEARPAPRAAKAARRSASVDRVELTANFGKGELITTGVVLPLGLGLAIGGPGLFGEPDPSMTSPTLGSIDYKLSIASHGDLREGNPFVYGVFDVAGIAYPATLGGFYLLSGLYYWAADEPMLGSQSVNIDHSMIGMAETVGWTSLTAGVVHALIGRQRPYVAFGRTAYGAAEGGGANLSFFSTTSAIAFAMSSFAARDYADQAMRKGGNPVTGVIAPYALLYGLSTVIGYSSIYNQQHYFSDVAVGALTGILIGNLVYVAHFDTDGNPRRRHARGETTAGPTLLQNPDGSMALGVGVSRRW